MNRRHFLKAAAGTVTAALVAPELVLPAQPEKRFWPLDRTMLGSGPNFITLTEDDHNYFQALNFEWEPQYKTFTFEPDLSNYPTMGDDRLSLQQFLDRCDDILKRTKMDLDHMMIYGTPHYRSD